MISIGNYFIKVVCRLLYYLAIFISSPFIFVLMLLDPIIWIISGKGNLCFFICSIIDRKLTKLLKIKKDF